MKTAEKKTSTHNKIQKLSSLGQQSLLLLFKLLFEDEGSTQEHKCDDPWTISTHHLLSGVKNGTYEHPIKTKNPGDVIVAYLFIELSVPNEFMHSSSYPVALYRISQAGNLYQNKMDVCNNSYILQTKTHK